MKWILLILFQQGATAVEFNSEEACEAAQKEIQWHAERVAEFGVMPYKTISHRCVPKGETDSSYQDFKKSFTVKEK